MSGQLAPDSEASGTELSPIEQLREDCRAVLDRQVIFNMIPDSGKVVVLDSRLLVRHALLALKDHDITEAPVYDSKFGKYCGMLTVTDFMHALLTLHENAEVLQKDSTGRFSDAVGIIPPPHLSSRSSSISSTDGMSPNSSTPSIASLASLSPPSISQKSSAPAESSSSSSSQSANSASKKSSSPSKTPKTGAARILRSLERDRIHDWNELKRRDGRARTTLHWIGPEDTLLSAVLKLRRNRIYRLCVMQLALDTVLYVLSQNSVIILLLRELRTQNKRKYDVTLKQLNIHRSLPKQFHMTFKNTLADAFRALKSARCSSVPICDAHGVLQDFISRDDLKFLRLDNLDLGLSLQAVVEQRKKGEKMAKKLLKCKLEMKLEDTMDLLESAARQNTSIFVLDEKDYVLGVLGGDDLLSFVVSEELSTMSAHLTGAAGSGLAGNEDDGLKHSAGSYPFGSEGADGQPQFDGRGTQNNTGISSPPNSSTPR
eukprot:g73537.t1